MDKIVFFKKNDSDAKIPFKKHLGDAGYDLYSIEDSYVSPHQTVEVNIGIGLQLPTNYYCEIHTRSSFGKIGARIHTGIIDSGFRGNITVFVTAGQVGLQILKGDRVAQLIFKKLVEVSFKEASYLENSSRGVDKFGSTGR